jgi:hypothetical protein
MKHQVLPSVEEVWRERRDALVDALTETIEELKGLLRLDEYHRHGHEPEQLERALGPLAASSLDLGSLSSVLEGSTRSRAMAPERRLRVESLIPLLTELSETWSNTALETALVDIDRPDDEIQELAGAHFSRLALVFRAERIAQLEIRSKYDSRIHDAAFASFYWRDLGPGELGLCPPFLVVAGLDDDCGPRLRRMMALLETGMPLKVLALRSGFHESHANASDTRIPAKMTVETLPLAMRGVYFLQTTVGAQDFREGMLAALASPRPGVISILGPRSHESPDAFKERAERAVRARAFPLCNYDPDRDSRFANCFDLSSNPSPDSLWTMDALTDGSSEGAPTEVEEPFTFAHFAASEPELAQELVEAPIDSHALVPLTDFLGLSRQQRIGKAPVISVAGSDGTIIRKVVGPNVVHRCAERLHLWRTLQELAGLDNPHVSASRSALERELGLERDAQLESLRQEMEQKAVEREKTAVTNAVRRLVARLAGASVKP